MLDEFNLVFRLESLVAAYVEYPFLSWLEFYNLRLVPLNNILEASLNVSFMN